MAELKRGDVVQKTSFFNGGCISFTRYGIVLQEYKNGDVQVMTGNAEDMYSGVWKRGTYCRTDKKVDMAVFVDMIGRGTV